MLAVILSAAVGTTGAASGPSPICHTIKEIQEGVRDQALPLFEVSKEANDGDIFVVRFTVRGNGYVERAELVGTSAKASWTTGEKMAGVFYGFTFRNTRCGPVTIDRYPIKVGPKATGR